MKKFRQTLLAASLCLGSLSMLAVPAMRRPQTVVQPDGSTITIIKTGDEFAHYITTTDGLLLKRDKAGFYCYGKLAVNGAVESTGIRAVNPELRASAPQQAEKLDIPAALQRRAAASPARIPQNGMGLYDSAYPTKGDVNVLVLLVEFNDVRFTLDKPFDYFNNMLNQEGFSEYGGTGSAKDYFRENSKDQFRPHFDVFGPITLAKDMKEYGGNDLYGDDVAPDVMVADACRMFDDKIDFSDYDMDGDGYVDNVYVFYAGQGEANYGDEDTIWPHSWNVQDYLSLDGVVISRYACSNEWEQNRPDGIGTFVHEYSHVMGLPDLYSTRGNLDCTPIEYSVMDYGPYNNEGRTPPAYSIVERNAVGWMEPEVISGPLNGRLEYIVDSNHGYIIPTAKENEFFLLENRQQTGWDEFIPGHGMIIWHIDFNQAIWDANAVNNDASHQYVEIEKANNQKNGSSLELMAGWTWPGTAQKTEFSDVTTPSMLSWDNTGQNLPITQIAEKDGIITFLVDGGVPKIATPIHDELIETGENYFVASWKPVEGANDYLLSVYQQGKGESATITNNMGENGKLDLGDWTSNSTQGYTSATNFGISAPALRMDADGQWLESPVLPGIARSVSFWVKGMNSKNSQLLVRGYANGQWVTLATIEPTSNKSSEHQLTELPANITKIRFDFKKVTGNLALDDVVVECSAPKSLLPGYYNLSTGGATSYRVEIPSEIEGDTFLYQVIATDGTDYSRASEMKTVVLGPNSISSIEAEEGTVEYFDILGRRVSNPAKGDILIRRCGNKTDKVIIR